MKVTRLVHTAARFLAQGQHWSVSLSIFLTFSHPLFYRAGSDKLFEILLCCDFLLLGFRVESTSVFTVPQGSDVPLLKIKH